MIIVTFIILQVMPCNTVAADQVYGIVDYV